MNSEEDEDLLQELELLRTNLKAPQTHTYDPSTRKFVSVYRDFTMVVTLPKNYPNHSGTARIEIHPHNEDALIRVNDVVNDVLPGEFMLYPLCQAFRSVVDKLMADRPAVPVPMPQPPQQQQQPMPQQMQQQQQPALNPAAVQQLQSIPPQVLVQMLATNPMPIPLDALTPQQRTALLTHMQQNQMLVGQVPPQGQQQMPMQMPGTPQRMSNNMQTMNNSFNNRSGGRAGSFSRRSEGLTRPDRVIERIMYDPVFKPAEFEVGYVDPVGTPTWVALNIFNTDAHQPSKGCPNDNIMYIRYKGEEIVWDRKEATESVDVVARRLMRGDRPERNRDNNRNNNKDDQRQNAMELTFKPLIGAYPILEPVEFVKNTSGSEDLATRTFTTMTWNLLCGLFDKDNKLRSDERVPLQFKAIENSNADIICLQEVTPAFFDALTKNEKIMKKYNVTKLPGDVSSGQIVMTRFAIEDANILRLSMQKHAIMCRVKSITERVVTVVNIHLISDYAKDPASRRLQELAAIGKQLEEEHDVIICGDFNFGDKDPEETAVPWGALLDSWNLLRGSEEGFTVNLDKNPLAMATMGELRKDSRRLDRVKTRGLLVPRDVHLYADTPAPDGLYPSSHFAVRATIMQEDDFLPFLPTVSMDQQCAIVILPPTSTWDQIDDVRRPHDKTFPRWMPHITLLHPFIQLAGNQGAVVASAISAIAKRFVPFRMRLRDFNYNACHSRSSLHLVAEALPPFESTIDRLYTMLAATYTMCARDNFVPNLTVGQFAAAEADKARAQLLVSWKPIVFDVTHIHIVSRSTRDDAMNVIHSIPLGSFAEPPPYPTPLEGFPTRVVPVDTPSEPLDPPPMVMEPAKHGNRPPEPYFPKDALETWMLTVTMTEYARTNPTHISQRGAMYHVPPTELCAYLQKWEDSIRESDKVPFFIEEVRGDVFRLYVDVDFKSTTHTKIELDKTGFVPVLLTHAAAVFPEADLTVCITECHGKWEDRYHPDTVYKSGFRFYFQNVWVNERVFRNFLDSLARVCEELLTMTSNAPRSVTWPEAVNTHSSIWDRTRLIGTIKKRRNAWRRYKLLTFVSATGDASEFAESRSKDKVLQVSAVPAHTTEAAQDVHKLLFATTVRVWDTQDEASIKAVLHNNAFAESKMYLEDRVNEAYMKPLLGNRRRRNKDSKEGSGKEGEEGVVQEQGPDDAVATPSRPRADSELPNTPQMEPSL